MIEHDFTFKLLRPADAAVLDNVHPDVFDETPVADRISAYLADPSHHLMVALFEGLVVAQVAAVTHRHPDKPTELYIDEVGVAEPWRRRGLAREMLLRMFDHGRSLGCAEAWVGTEVDNLPARGLYDRLPDGREAEPFMLHVYDL